MAEWVKVGEISRYAQANAPMTNSLEQLAAECCPEWAETPAGQRRVDYDIESKTFALFVWKEVPERNGRTIPMAEWIPPVTNTFAGRVAYAERRLRTAIEVLKTKKENQTMTPYDFKIVRRTKESEQIINTGHLLAKSNEDAKLRVVAEVDDFEPDTDEVIVRPFCG